MRRVGILLVVVLLTACSHKQNSSGPPGTAAKGAWRTIQQAASALCERATPEPAHLAASFPTTIADFRATTIGTVGPSQTRRFPSMAAADFGAWCWTGRAGAYDVYEVASDGTKQLVASGMVGNPETNQGRPDVP